jgi:DHA1 family inner membrane transport protein
LRPGIDGGYARTVALVEPSGGPGISSEVVDELDGANTPAFTDHEPGEREKQVVLQLSNVSHGINHFQNQMMAMLYPSIMAALGMSYTEVGSLSAIRSVVTSLSQGSFGFVTPFFSRCKILGASNFVMALGTVLSGLAMGYPTMVVARCVAALGSSAQHPVGYSILASYFPTRRGSAIALNTTAGSIGTLVATPLATGMLLLMGWREIFYIVAFASLVMGVVYFLFRDYGAPDRSGSGKARLARGWRSYRRVLANRNMMIIALVFMIGAAGSEAGINQTYFAPHLANDFGYSTVLVGIMLFAISLGGLGGPIVFGWFSDRFSRTMVLQLSLLLSAAATLWVAWLGPAEVLMFVSLVVYSAVTSSRGTLTQTIVADIASDEDRDAAFSLYSLLGFLAQPFWLLITGVLMDTAGFTVAVSRVSVSYVLAMILLIFVKDIAGSGSDPRTVGRSNRGAA